MYYWTSPEIRYENVATSTTIDVITLQPKAYTSKARWRSIAMLDVFREE